MSVALEDLAQNAELYNPCMEAQNADTCMAVPHRPKLKCQIAWLIRKTYLGFRFTA